MTAKKCCVFCNRKKDAAADYKGIKKIKIRSLLFSKHQTLTTRNIHCCSVACQEKVIKNGVPAARLISYPKPLWVDWRIHSWLVRNRVDSIYQLPPLQRLFAKNKLKAQLIEPRVLNHPPEAAIPKTRLCWHFMTDKQLVAWCGLTRDQIEILACCGPQRISPMAILIFFTQFYRAVGFYCIEALYGYSRQTCGLVFDAVKDWLVKYEVPTQLISGDYEMNKRVWTRDRIKNATPNYYYALHSKPTPTIPPPPPLRTEAESNASQAKKNKLLSKDFAEWKRKHFVASAELNAREDNRRDALAKKAQENKEDDEKQISLPSAVVKGSPNRNRSKEECDSDCDCLHCIQPQQSYKKSKVKNSARFSHIIIASDGTYGYVQRVNSHRVAKKAWSEQKKRVLYKPHITIAVNGKAIMCQTFFANGHNTDQSISNAQFSAAYVRWCSENVNHRDCIFNQEQIDELTYFQQFVYLPGDVHLVDGGYYFALDERFRAPPRVHKSDDDAQFSIAQTNEKALVTLYRGVIERYFAYVKRFKMLGEVLNWHHIRDYDKLWKIGCAITNHFGPDLTADCKRNDNIVKRIENCAQFERNHLEDAIEEYNQQKKDENAVGWTVVAKTKQDVLDYLINLPWLEDLKMSMDDWDFYCGQRYISKIAKPYLQSLADNFELRMCRDNPYLLRFSHLKSKFRSGAEHSVYLNFANCGDVLAPAPWNRRYAGRKRELWGDSDLTSVQHYCATCNNGRRMIFPDVHSAAILLLIVALRNNCLHTVMSNPIVESSVPLRVIDAEASKRWLEANGISKKDVIANQICLNSLRKQKKIAPRTRKTRERSSAKSPIKSKPAKRNRNRNSNSNSNANAAAMEEDELDLAASQLLQQNNSTDLDLAAQSVNTIRCDECNNLYPILDGEEFEEDEYFLCPSCFPY